MDFRLRGLLAFGIMVGILPTAFGSLNEKIKQKVVNTCAEDEMCSFSWNCDNIRKPLRNCQGPFFYFTVCCRIGSGSGDKITNEIEDTVPAATNPPTTPTTTTATTTTTITTTTTTTVRRPSLPTCGQAPLVLRGPRIVGGSQAQFGEYPYQLMLVIRGAEKCGATLIAPQWIVTAGHCIASGSVQPNEVIVLLGLYDRARNSDMFPIEQRRAAKLFVHPQYNSERSFSHDITLIQLDSPVEFRPYIQPVCLPSPNDDFVGEVGTISGWGRLQFREDRPGILQHTEIPLIPTSLCEDMFEKQLGRREGIKLDMICAGTEEGGKDACQGDSGGPMTVTRNGTFILAGIVSFGYGCGLPGYPGVYTKVSSMVPWILETMRKES